MVSPWTLKPWAKRGAEPLPWLPAPALVMTKGEEQGGCEAPFQVWHQEVLWDLVKVELWNPLGP